MCWSILITKFIIKTKAWKRGGLKEERIVRELIRKEEAEERNRQH